MSEEILDELQRDTFDFFLHETNPTNGLVPDHTNSGAPSSIAAVGLSLAAYTVGVERGFITRAEASRRTLTALRFFWNSPQGPEPDTTGYKGFFYHFLDMQTGRRAWNCELSTIDTTFLIAGALAAAAYFDFDSEDEREIRTLADALCRRVDWQWALNGAPAVAHGWKPESGFLNYRWEGYNEAILLYALGLGSPTFPLPPESYRAFTCTYQWENLYGCDFLFAGPLFIHQLSHVWIDFRGIQDEFMRAKGIDYFENTRRATLLQQQYAIRNPLEFEGYGEHCWGLTAGAGPGPATRRTHGIQRRFYSYAARGIPYGPDDGTLAPWAAVASLPFAPEIVLPTIDYINNIHHEMLSEYGYLCSFNPTFTNGSQGETSRTGWISNAYYGLDQGPIILMIENYRTGFFWKLMRRCPYLAVGLRRAGFRGGWL